MPHLSVNINKVATLRNTRPLDYPSPLHFARIALEAGAAGITVHPRPDQRHIRPADVTAVAELLRHWPDREFNIEGNPFHGYLPIIQAAKPDQCTLVPDDVAQVTSDHGYNLLDPETFARLKDLLPQLRPHTRRISLFMDPDPAQIERAADLGVDRVELYTQPYAEAFTSGQYGRVLDQYVQAANSARAAGLGLNAGHDLTLDNLPPLVAAIPFLDEVSIGHALIADALELGMSEAVRRYLQAAGDSRGK